MFNLSLIAIFLTLASAKFGVLQFLQSGDVQTFECYLQNKVSLVISRAWDQNTGPIPEFTDSYRNAKIAGIPNFDALIRINDATEPRQICKETVHTLPSEFDGRVWISFDLRWNRTYEERMSYLDNVIQTCQQHGLRMGIYSDNRTWTNIFKHKRASSEIVESLPVFYVDPYSVEQNFNGFKFASFGNWTAPAMKDYAGITWGYCGSAISARIFYEN